jgi:hypothetical protein
MGPGDLVGECAYHLFAVSFAYAARQQANQRAIESQR